MINVQFSMVSILRQTSNLMKIIENKGSFLTSLYLSLIFLVLRFGTAPNTSSLEGSCARVVRSNYNTDVYFPLHLVILVFCFVHVLQSVKSGTFSFLELIILLPVLVYFIDIFV